MYNTLVHSNIGLRIVVTNIEYSLLASAAESTNIIPLVLTEPQPSSSSIADSTATTILQSTYSPISSSYDPKVPSVLLQ